MDWSRFTLTEGKAVIATPCVDVVAFSSEPPTPAGAKGFDRFLRTFADRFGDRLTFYRTGDMKKYRRVDARTLDGPYHWFTDVKVLKKKMLALVAHSGAAERTAAPPALDLMLWGFDDPPQFAFRMALPVEVADKPDALVKFVQDALAEFPLAHGFCGYSFEWDEMSVDEEANEWAGPLLLRHPGLNYMSAVALSRAASSGVVAVSWLTFLGPEISQALGGQKALTKAAPAGVSVLPLGKGGVLLRAGKQPELGDVNRRERLPLYRSVGRLVSPSRASDEELEDLNIQGISDEAAIDWLRRFF
jgi:TseV toxin immunity protein TsiV